MLSVLVNRALEALGDGGSSDTIAPDLTREDELVVDGEGMHGPELVVDLAPEGEAAHRVPDLYRVVRPAVKLVLKKCETRAQISAKAATVM